MRLSCTLRLPSVGHCDFSGRPFSGMAVLHAVTRYGHSSGHERLCRMSTGRGYVPPIREDSRRSLLGIEELGLHQADCIGCEEMLRSSCNHAQRVVSERVPLPSIQITIGLLSTWQIAQQIQAWPNTFDKSFVALLGYSSSLTEQSTEQPLVPASQLCGQPPS